MPSYHLLFVIYFNPIFTIPVSIHRKRYNIAMLTYNHKVSSPEVTHSLNNNLRYSHKLKDNTTEKLHI